jgi:CTP:molybdopterin cytidylyltransferase MocA
MGQPKQIMRWGSTVIVRRVVEVLAEGGVDEIVAVTGGARLEVEAALQGSAARGVLNPDFANGDMMRSLQVGLAALSPSAEAALVALGDQPQIEAGVVRAVTQHWRRARADIVAPSFNRRRGHPVLFGRSIWAAIGAAAVTSPRDFLQAHAAQIVYVNVDTDSILRDVDTPEDYERETGGQG